MSAAVRERVREVAPRVQAWFAFAGGLTAYAAHLVVTFWLLAAGCPPGTAATIVIATVVAIAVAAAAVAVGIVLNRRAGSAAEHAHETTADAAGGPPAGWDTSSAAAAPPWLATVGIFLSGLSLVIIVLSGVAALLLPRCPS